MSQPDYPVPNNLEPHHEPITPERLVSFSDAVIAISITLLVLDIKVPRVAPHQTLWMALQGQWTQYLGFVISFSMTATAWINHHRLFLYIHRTDYKLMVLNMLLLLYITVLPFTTALLTQYLPDATYAPTATVVYGLTLSVGGVFFNAIWWYVVSQPYLLKASATAVIARRLKWYLGSGLLVAIGATLLAYLSVPASLGLYVCLVGFFLLDINRQRT